MISARQGADSLEYNNHLYWTLQNNHLKINCATDIWDVYPDEQLLTLTYRHKWDINQVKNLTLEHVYELGTIVFQSHTNLESVDVKSGLKIIGLGAFIDCKWLKTVYLPSSLDSIGAHTFEGCISFSDLYFDGSDTQWNQEVSKGKNWNPYATKVHWHCTVTFNANDHGTAPAAQYIHWSNQDKATEPAVPTATGYIFKGWYTEAACTNQWNFNNVVPGDMTLYAKWEAVLQRGDINGDGEVDVSDVNIIINIMLGKAQTSSYPGNPDLNNDNNVDVSDINAIINIMLGK